MAERHLQFPVLLSIAAALVTLVLKFTSYYLTGSLGLLSDAAESIVNLLAAAVAFLSLLYAARPVDASHTYGHEKIEFFSSGLEGTLVIVAAVGIGWAAVERLLFPVALQKLDLGILICAAAAVINLGVARLLLRVGRAHCSIVLEADGQHLMTDVWTSVAVIAGVGLVGLTKIEPIDPLMALLMAGYIGWTGFDLVRRSFNGLMDHSLPAAEQADLRKAIEARLEPGMTYHAFRTRQAGARRFVDFHLLVPGSLTVKQAHAAGDRIEEALRAAVPSVEITLHIEPIEDPAAWENNELLKMEQAEKMKDQPG